MDFSHALLAAKAGQKISREGWNGKGQYVVAQKGYPEGIAINENTAKATGIAVGTVQKFGPYLMIKAVDGTFVPWLASQGDLFADDWTASFPS